MPGCRSSNDLVVGNLPGLGTRPALWSGRESWRYLATAVEGVGWGSSAGLVLKRLKLVRCIYVGTVVIS